MKSPYRIRAVEGDDELNALTLCELHDATFIGLAPPIDPTKGDWWIVEAAGKPVGFASMHPANDVLSRGAYMSRSGVLPDHRGHGLQLRLIRTRERAARRYGWRVAYTDTTDNPASANSLIHAGYRIYRPDKPWALKHSIYWKREL